jgi:hypothetical protein
MVQTLGELLDRTTPNAPDKASGRLRESAVYRGVSTANSSLLTSLDRLGGIDPPHTKGQLEEHLLRNFIRYGQPFFREHAEDLWHVMVAAEHHGLPTRLLDWTHSPLIAAHFATLTPSASPPTDRIIWKLNWKQVHRRFGLREVVFLVDDLQSVLRERGFDSSWEFLNGRPQIRPFVCLLEPTAFTPRLQLQSGAFTLASSKDKSLEALLAEAQLEHALEQFIIPWERVDFVRDQLDVCEIDERHLFPGLEGIASELRRYYHASANTEGAQPAEKQTS